MASSFTADGSAGGAFVCEAGDYAIGRSEVTTAEPTVQVSFSFSVARRPLYLRVGSTAGGQEIVTDTEFRPGEHVFTFAPGVSPYYVEFQLREVGEATLSDFARVAPGLLSLPTPWENLDPPALRSEQSLNTQWWCDGLDEPRALERRGTNSWSLRKFQPKDGPFEPDDTTSTTMTPSGRTGTVTVTASAPVFKSTDAGSLIRLTQAGQYETATVDAVSEQTDAIRVTGTGSARSFFYTVSGTFVGTVTLQRSVGGELNYQDVSSITSPVSLPLTDGLDGQIVYYRLRMTAYTSGSAVCELTYSGGITDGVARIYTVDADNAVTVDVLEPFATTTATSIWARGSWSDRFGWPTAVALFDGRLTFLRAGRRWQSASDDFESFATGADDGAAISGSIPGQLNSARWLKAAERLTFGTAGAEGFFYTGTQDVVMTPSDTRARVRTMRGSLNADAILVDGIPAFIHRSGRKILLMQFNGDSSYNLINLSEIHRDIAGVGSGSFVEGAYQSEPEPRLHIVRDDGQMATQLFSMSEQLGPFSRIVPSGTAAKIESVCVVPGTPEDHVYRVVSRTIDGGTKRYVEKVARERWTDSTQAWRLECALAYDGVATATITNLDHLEGEEVYAWADGRISGPHTVTAGEITLDYEAEYAIVGLKYQGRYKGPPVASGGAFGGSLTQWKKAERLGFLLLNTVGGGVSWGRDFTTMDTLPDRGTEETFDSATGLWTGAQSFPINGSWSRDARVCFRFEGVGPASVLGLIPGIVGNGQ